MFHFPACAVAALQSPLATRDQQRELHSSVPLKPSMEPAIYTCFLHSALKFMGFTGVCPKLSRGAGRLQPGYKTQQGSRHRDWPSTGECQQLQQCNIIIYNIQYFFPHAIVQRNLKCTDLWKMSDLCLYQQSHPTNFTELTTSNMWLSEDATGALPGFPTEIRWQRHLKTAC